jgi:hypothetical protein
MLVRENQSMSTQRWEPPADPEEPALLEPTQSEIDAWAAQERIRREAWLNGPTADQKAAWARRERERRMLERDVSDVRGGVRDSSRLVQRYVREMQLAAEGAVSLFFNSSPSEVFNNLVQAGRDWEEEFTNQPPRRKRVKLEPDTPAQPAVPPPASPREEPKRPS